MVYQSDIQTLKILGFDKWVFYEAIAFLEENLSEEDWDLELEEIESLLFSYWMCK